MRALLALFFLPLFAGSVISAPVPDVAAIIQKLGENANDSAITERRTAITYSRESRVDYLGDNDQVRKRVVRHYVVQPEDGRSVTKLIAVNGKPASEKEGHKSQVRETGEKSRTLSLSDDLLSRYEFTFVGEDLLQGRKAWMLRFKARHDVETDGFFDKLVNAMAGVIWVDAEETQLAKAEIHLGKKVSFFGGFAGAIERLDLTLVQRRIEPNVWLGETVFIDFTGRKLLSSIRFRCYEKCSEFRRFVEAAVRQ